MGGGHGHYAGLPHAAEAGDVLQGWGGKGWGCGWSAPELGVTWDGDTATTRTRLSQGPARGSREQIWT